ncbi:MULTISPECIES: type VII secretion-associated serine protease mycosin [unclassified Streptomyces]|uniref:type VII secretion-associated serine protease mycosin n=1 Tax=unclassified Streptomyces TaxID=2593676 RepID=UPI00093DD52F|nr:type VII secretion-associated serine protease mycosin [Streptomyces sp. CB02058]OKI95569.1 serine protease [Streptomyces sp. CB02058]
MHTSSIGSNSAVNGRRGLALSVLLGLLLVGTPVASAVADSVRSKQWHLDAMKAEEMWKTSTGSGVTVAVIDSGVEATNQDLVGQVLDGKNLAAGSPGDEHSDYNGHGTAMAGLIAGTGKSGGGDGAFGLAPGVKILPVRLSDSTKAANQAAADKKFNEEIPAAIRYAVDAGASVINISLGHATESAGLAEAVRYALDKDALIFAAVGNTGDGANLVEYPAGTPGVVGVGAIGEDLRKTGESQYGPQVDLTAPGEDLVYACAGETGLCEGHGSSDASALASASAALIWSKHPDWTNNQVLRVLLNTAGGPTTGEERADDIGYGIVRPRIALTTPGDPGPADEYPLPDLAAAASPAPSAEPSKAAAGAEKGDEPAAAAPAADDEGGNAALWIGLGIGAVVVLGVVAAIIRSRRRTAPPAAPTAAPYAYQQPQPPHHPAYGPPQGPNGPYGGPPQGPGA